MSFVFDSMACERWLLLKRIVVAILLSACVSAQVGPPVRTVQGNAVVSARDPKVRIKVPKTAQYVGADRWILYDIADCELHVFVDADANNNVQHLYWVQFESYVPTRPELAHTYDSPRHATLGGMDFYVDTWVRPTDGETTPGSDWEHVKTLLRHKNFHLPAGMMSVRLVHLLDSTKRKELMIIYAEDVLPTGFTAPQLADGGAEHGRWPAIADRLVETAKGKLQLAQ